MQFTNYILEYLDLQRATYKKDILTLSVNREVFDKICSRVQDYIHNRKSKSTSEKVVKLYFLIAFLARENFKQIKNEIFYSISKDHSCLKSYKDILKQLNLIEYNYQSNFKIESKKKTYREITSYKIIPILNRSFTKEKYIKLTYHIPRKLYKENTDTVFKLNNRIIKKIGISLGRNTFDVTPMEINELQAQKQENTTFENYCKIYQKIFKPFDPVTNISLQNSVAHLAEDGRLYHAFHTISRRARKQLTLDDEPLIEAFDVHNCRFTLLNVLICQNTSISQLEKNRYYDLTISGKLYEDIVQFWNNYYNTDIFTRDYIKDKVNKYLCENNKIINNSYFYKSSARRKHLMITDLYFKHNFPNIKQFIFDNKDTLLKQLNTVETNLITYHICIEEMLNKRGIKAISLHDGIYVKESDYKFLKENNISLEKFFYDKLYMYKFL